jgi:hypothetical protein
LIVDLPPSVGTENGSVANSRRVQIYTDSSIVPRERPSLYCNSEEYSIRTIRAQHVFCSE